jgi:hypothetical protein
MWVWWRAVPDDGYVAGGGGGKKGRVRVWGCQTQPRTRWMPSERRTQAPHTQTQAMVLGQPRFFSFFLFLHFSFLFFLFKFELFKLNISQNINIFSN